MQLTDKSILTCGGYLVLVGLYAFLLQQFQDLLTGLDHFFEGFGLAFLSLRQTFLGLFALTLQTTHLLQLRNHEPEGTLPFLRFLLELAVDGVDALRYDGGILCRDVFGVEGFLQLLLQLPQVLYRHFVKAVEDCLPVDRLLQFAHVEFRQFLIQFALQSQTLTGILRLADLQSVLLLKRQFLLLVVAIQQQIFVDGGLLSTLLLLQFLLETKTLTLVLRSLDALGIVLGYGLLALLIVAVLLQEITHRLALRLIDSLRSAYALFLVGFIGFLPFFDFLLCI